MNRNRTEQPATEARHVASFLEFAQLEAEIIPGDRPDVVLVVGRQRVGLEHQELTEDDLASTSSNLTWLEGELREELRRRGADRNFHVAIGVNAASSVFRRRRDLVELTRRVGGLAMDRAPSVTREKELEVFAQELHPLGIIGPDFVYLSRASGALQGPLATVSRGFWGPGDSGVVEAIRKKEKLLPVFRGGVDLSKLVFAGDRELNDGRPMMDELARLANHDERPTRGLATCLGTLLVLPRFDLVDGAGP